MAISDLKNIKEGDEFFVDENIHWVTFEDDILYVSIFHNTYAESAPHNGYIMALDMNDNFRVLWKTEPLTCNTDNFVVTDDAIICGYGFTKEDDFIYVLDKKTGIRTQSYKVKTGPDWFFVKDNELYVRCYDTDYVFNLINPADNQQDLWYNIRTIYQEGGIANEQFLNLYREVPSLNSRQPMIGDRILYIKAFASFADAVLLHFKWQVLCG